MFPRVRFRCLGCPTTRRCTHISIRYLILNIFNYIYIYIYMSKIRLSIGEGIGLERLRVFLINCILDNGMDHILAKRINSIKIMSFSQIEEFIIEEHIQMRLLSKYCVDYNLRYVYHIEEELKK